MATIRCTCCGNSCDESTASFGESGLICDSCARRESARDVAQMMHDVHAVERMGDPGAGALQGSMTPVLIGSTHRGPAPRTRAHAELEQRGAIVQQVSLSSTFHVGPIGASREGLQEIWTLPSAPSVQGTFASEGFFTMVKKLFTHEIQTGDEAFDRAVFIRTTTPEATQAWLAFPDVRSALVAIVKSGETFSIEGNIVTGAIYWGVGEVGSPEVIAQLVASLR